MTISELQSGSNCEPTEQIKELFRQLDLDDPRVIRYFEKLEELGRQSEPPRVWLRTNIHSVCPTFDQ